MNFEKWKAVAQVLQNGWISEKYLPLQLAKSFLEMCIFGELKSDLTVFLISYANIKKRLYNMQLTILMMLIKMTCLKLWKIIVQVSSY